MKKIISMLLVLAMLLALAVPAFAAETKTYYLLDNRTRVWYVSANGTDGYVKEPMENLGDYLHKVTLPADCTIIQFRSDDGMNIVDKFEGTGNLCTIGEAYEVTDGASYKGIWSEYTPAPALTQPTNNTADVSGSFVKAEESAVVYSVSITWGALDFTYNEGKQGTWNPETLSYDNPEEGGWLWETANSNNAITVENASNAAVTAVLSFASADGLDLTGAFMDAAAAGEGNAISGAISLASAAPAEGEEIGAAQSATAYFHITDGMLDAEAMGEEESITLGTITVTFAAVEADT